MCKKQLNDTAADDRSRTIFTRTIRNLITLLSGALATIFVWIQFSNFPFVDIVSSSITPIVLWHGALALYYTSWVVGTTFDVDVQEDVYADFPQPGKVPLHGFMVVLLLAIGAAMLLWTERHLQRFAIAISIFLSLIIWRGDTSSGF